MNIAAKLEPDRERITTMMSEFESIRDGRLGTIKSVRNRIELDPTDTRPIHLKPYRGGPKARQLKKED